ncbi:MAG: hypothetical protein OXI87_00610 [Albidovulum sp.]|nr:hypothetical protein [Albidovulum sp.]MDE0303374.1 hypothetical protein [Albidovulum sp.]
MAAERRLASPSLRDTGYRAAVKGVRRRMIGRLGARKNSKQRNAGFRKALEALDETATITCAIAAGAFP